MGEGVLERASSILRRRRVHQLHDGRGRRSHPGDVRQELRPSDEDQEALRSGEPVPRKSEHQADVKEGPEIKLLIRRLHVQVTWFLRNVLVAEFWAGPLEFVVLRATGEH